MGGKAFDWPEEHQEIVRKEYATTDTNELAKRLGKTPMAVRQLAQRLGVRKTKAYLQEARRKVAKNYDKNRFKL